jgi:site-specific DNA recombinase
MRIAILARVSSHRQERDETIETQLDYGRKWADLNGHVIVDIYPDEAVSGLIPVVDRHEGGRLMKDAAAGKWEAVAAYRLDRVGRSVLVIHTAIEYFDRHNIKFLSMTEPYDTSTREGKMLMGILALFAEWERDAIRQRCYDGKIRAATNGTWIGGREPFGYRLEGKQILVNEETASFVRDIFRLYVDESYGMQKIAYQWTQRGLPPPSQVRGEARGKSGRWWATTIRDILTNPVYKGEQHWGEVDCPHPVPALVEPAQWDAAQLKMETNRQFKTPSHGRSYLLSGLVRCGMPGCGSACIGTVWKNGKKVPEDTHYYVCGSKINYRNRGRERCQGPWLHGSIDDQVLGDCQEMLDNPGLLASLLREQRQGDRAIQEELIGERDALLEQKAGQRMERERLLSALRRGRISEEEFDREDDKIKEETVWYNGEISRLDLRLAAVQQEDLALADVESLINELRGRSLPATEMVRVLVREVVIAIGEGGQPHVKVSYWPSEQTMGNTSTRPSLYHCLPFIRAYDLPLAA